MSWYFAPPELDQQQQPAYVPLDVVSYRVPSVETARDDIKRTAELVVATTSTALPPMPVDDDPKLLALYVQALQEQRKLESVQLMRDRLFLFRRMIVEGGVAAQTARDELKINAELHRVNKDSGKHLGKYIKLIRENAKPTPEQLADLRFAVEKSTADKVALFDAYRERVAPHIPPSKMHEEQAKQIREQYKKSVEAARKDLKQAAAEVKQAVHELRKDLHEIAKEAKKEEKDMRNALKDLAPPQDAAQVHDEILIKSDIARAEINKRAEVAERRDQAATAAAVSSAIAANTPADYASALQAGEHANLLSVRK